MLLSPSVHFAQFAENESGVATCRVHLWNWSAAESDLRSCRAGAVAMVESLSKSPAPQTVFRDCETRDIPQHEVTQLTEAH